MEEVYFHIEMLKKRSVTNGEQALFLGMRGAIRQLPSVTPERKTGKWILIDDNHLLTKNIYKCSICGEVISEMRGYNVYKSFPYSHCGAKMGGGVNCNAED